MFINERKEYNPNGQDLVFYIFQCDDCKNKFEKKTYNENLLQNHFCSKICRNKANSIGGIVYNKRVKTCLEKYGTENPMQSKIVQDKTIATNIEKFGVKSNLMLSTVNKKKGPTSPETKLKISQTKKRNFALKQLNKQKITIIQNIKSERSKKFYFKKPHQGRKYTYNFKSNPKFRANKNYFGGLIRDHYNNKIINTIIKNHGIYNVELFKQIPFNHLTHWNKKYGVIHYMQLPEIKEKIRLTMMNRYGVSSGMALRIIRGEDLRITAKKIRATRKLNGTYHNSKEENNIYKLLCEKFTKENIECQPEINNWSLDFYIKSIDIYVEYNGSYYHGLNRPIAVIKQCKTKHDKRIYITFLKDQDKVKWFAQNNKKLVVLLDKDTKADIFRKLDI